jgi:hypothetical protein
MSAVVKDNLDYIAADSGTNALGPVTPLGSGKIYIRQRCDCSWIRHLTKDVKGRVKGRPWRSGNWLRPPVDLQHWIQ